MEQNVQYLMRMKSKQLLNSHLQAASMNSFLPSWEEQAFAEDAAGPLGGFVWPPRSYSCSFCRREFRSAQALGGHMNVHRRDRARLRQSLCNENPCLLPAAGTDHQDHHHSANDYQGNDSGCSNSNSGLFAAYSSPFSSPPNSRASAAAVISQENSSEEAYILPFSSNIIREQQRRFPYSPSSPDDSNSVKLLSISSNSRTSTPIRLRSRNHEDAVETNLSLGINSHSEELKINSKRLKSSSLLPFYHKPCSSDRFPFQFASTIDDIDLELRLGDSPAVK